MTYFKPGVPMTRWTIALLLSLAASPALAQGFSSGSDGSDGALDVTASGDFNPAALGIDADGDNVFHFTSVNVAAGVTLRLRASILGEGKPVVWLASGAVTIEGTLNLDGAPGHNAGAAPLRSEPGAGGYSGGAGRTALVRATSGAGPGGGVVSPGHSGGGAGHAFPGANSVSNPSAGNGGPAYGNVFLLPLIGGSGGSGNDFLGALGGGAGGGAVLIASDVQITVNGAISARGGGNSSNNEGAGSGGAIRLIAPSCSGSGELRVGGSSGTSSPGRARIEAFSQQLTNVNPSNVATYARPGVVFLPADAPKVRATSFTLTDSSTVAIPASPTGSYVMPDAVLNSSDPMTLNLAAENVPTGTQVQIRIVPEGAPAILLTSTPLAGSKASSTATTPSFSLPTGFSRFSIVATFIP